MSYEVDNLLDMRNFVNVDNNFVKVTLLGNQKIHIERVSTPTGFIYISVDVPITITEGNYVFIVKGTTRIFSNYGFSPFLSFLSSGGNGVTASWAINQYSTIGDSSVAYYIKNYSAEQVAQITKVRVYLRFGTSFTDNTYDGDWQFMFFRYTNNMSLQAPIMYEETIASPYYLTPYNITLPTSWGINSNPAIGRANLTLSYDGSEEVRTVVAVGVETLSNIPLTSAGTNKWNFKMPFEDVGVTATYRIYYTVRTSSNSGGSIAASKTRAEEGDTIRITITKNNGYYLYSINSAEVILEKESDTVYTFRMPSLNVSVTAAFAENDHANIIVEAANGGHIRADPTLAYEGETVTLSITTNEGYTFQGLSVTRNNRLVNVNKVDDSHYTFVVENLNV